MVDVRFVENLKNTFSRLISINKIPLQDEWQVFFFLFRKYKEYTSPNKNNYRLTYLDD